MSFFDSEKNVLFKSKTPKSYPLGKLINNKFNESEFLRYRFLGTGLSSFHLKNVVMEKSQGREAEINGKRIINFGSANYLGLDKHERVIKASQQALELWGSHAGSSRIFFSQQNILDLEAELSLLLGAEKTLIGHNVSQIHQGVIPALFSGNCDIFIDKYAHTSIYQASLIAKAKGANIITVDVSDLEKIYKLLNQSKKSVKAIMIDGVYSMQGHTPDLKKLSDICEKTNTVFYIDDAHGVGVFGERGGGVMEDSNFNNQLVVGSLQKAFGTYGGFISGNRDVIEYLRIMSKSYVFSGTIQPSAVEGARAAVQIVTSEEGKKLRKRLFDISNLVRQKIEKLGFNIHPASSPIIAVEIGDDIKTLMAGRRMFDEGIYLNSVVYPAVSRGRGILRISMNSIHSDDDINKLVNAFSELKVYLKKHESKWKSYSHTIKEIIKANFQAADYRGLR